jgi:hypothetical protein
MKSHLAWSDSSWDELAPPVEFEVLHKLEDLGELPGQVAPHLPRSACRFQEEE